MGINEKHFALNSAVDFMMGLIQDGKSYCDALFTVSVMYDVSEDEIENAYIEATA